MKKLYLFTLSLAVALTAAAAPLKMRSEVSNMLPDYQNRGKELKANFEKAEQPIVKKSVKAHKAVMKSLRKVDAGESLAGRWEVVYIDDMFQSSTGESYTVAYNAKMYTDPVYGDYYTFTTANQNFLPFIIDTGILENQYEIMYQAVAEFTTGEYLGQQGFYIANNQLQRPAELMLDYDSTTGELSYGNAEWGIIWPVLDSELTSEIDIYDALTIDSCRKGEAPGPDPGVDDEDWTSIGFAKFVDGWVLPLFGIDQFEYEYEVGIQQNNNKETRYRLVNPYKSGPVADYNQSTSDGYIVFDIADPAHVSFNAVDAGFAYLGAGLSEMYCYNTLTLFALYYGVSYADIVSQLGDVIPYTTYKDGVVSLDFIIDEGENWYDACFGDQTDPAGGFQWQDSEGVVPDMRCRITLPKVEDNAVSAIESEENAPARYFNLQGVEVENPAKGSIVICRQGSKSSKMVVK